MSSRVEKLAALRAWQQNLPTPARACLDVVVVLLVSVVSIIAIILQAVHFLYVTITSSRSTGGQKQHDLSHDCKYPSPCLGCNKIIADTAFRLQTGPFTPLVNSACNTIVKTSLMSPRDAMIHISSITSALYVKVNDAAVVNPVRLEALDPSPSFEASHALIREMSTLIEWSLMPNQVGHAFSRRARTWH